MGKYGYMADFPIANFPGDDMGGCVEGGRGGETKYFTISAEEN